MCHMLCYEHNMYKQRFNKSGSRTTPFKTLLHLITPVPNPSPEERVATGSYSLTMKKGETVEPKGNRAY